MGRSSKRMCLILAFDYMASVNKTSTQLRRWEVEPRPAAQREAAMCEASFKRLGFDVQTYMNLEAEKFYTMAEQVLKKMPDDVDAFALVIIGRVVKLPDRSEGVAFESGCVDIQKIQKTFQPRVPHSKLAGKQKLIIYDIDTPRGGHHNHSGFGGQPGKDISPIIRQLTQELDKHDPSDDTANILISVVYEVRLDSEEQQ